MSEAAYSDEFENFDYDNDDNDDDEEECFDFINVDDLISVSNYVYNPEIDKTSNILLALFKSNEMLCCRRTTFTYDYKDYNKWVETVNAFKKNDKYCYKYRVLIDETEIISILLNECEYLELMNRNE
jgi:hypothetical protein